VTLEKGTDEYYRELAAALEGVLPLVEILRKAPGGEVDNAGDSLRERRSFYRQLYGFMAVAELIEPESRDDFNEICERIGITANDQFRLYMAYRTTELTLQKARAGLQSFRRNNSY
jgi:hypothetical protein